MASFDELSWDELMAFEKEKSQPLSLSDDDVKRFNYRTILYKMDQENYAVPLIADANSGVSFISDLLTEMAADEYLTIGGSAYEIAPKGRQELETMADQYHSLVEHYDVFAGVDLDSSCFIEADEDPGEQVEIEGELYDRFVDLRVAVMRFKDISPFDMVFLNLLREGRIGAKDNWEFDMALGKELYQEIEDIVNSAYNLEDLTGLGKENDNGEIPGSDILKDVIVAGNAVNQERKQAAREAEAAAQAEAEAEQEQEQQLFQDHEYETVTYYEHYQDPFYVEPCWQRNHYRRWF